MALYERIKLWETTVTTGEGPVDTVGYYTSEEKARACAAINKAPFVEIHELNGLKVGEEYFIGCRVVVVDQPPRVLTLREKSTAQVLIEQNRGA